LPQLKPCMSDVHVLAQSGDLGSVCELLDLDPSVLDMPDSTPLGQGNRALHYAAYEGHTAVVGALIERGCDVNSRNALGATALFFAAQQERSAVVQRLLAAAADPSIGETTHGFLPVDVASGECKSQLLAVAPGLSRPAAPSLVEASVGPRGSISVSWTAAAQSRPLRGFNVAIWRASGPESGPESVRPHFCGPGVEAWEVRPRFFGEPLLFAVQALGLSAPSEWVEGADPVTPFAAPAQPRPPRCVGVSRARGAVRCRLQWARTDVDSRGSPVTGWELSCCFVSFSSHPVSTVASDRSALSQELKLPRGWAIERTLTIALEGSSEGADPCDVPELGAVVFRLAAVNAAGRSAFSGGTVVAASDAAPAAASGESAEAAAAASD